MSKIHKDARSLKQQWLAENGEAIASINAVMERHGLLASKLRYRPTLPAQSSLPGLNKN